jgi:predicted nuclease of predicted toxin-antitoxin system
MKFIIDAQLPQLLADWLKERGFDAVHTLELPAANRSDDKEIIVVADQDDRVVISKDSDFFDDHILTGKPKRLLVIKTGNIKNRDLIRLFEGNIKRIESLFKRYVLLEMNRSELIVHR